ncbi:sensor histidine kinase [Emticicia fontis]
MHFKSIPKLELFSFLFSMPFIVCVAHLFMYENTIWQDSRLWLYSFPLVFVLGFIVWLIRLRYNQYLERIYPQVQQSFARISRKLISLLLICLVGTFVPVTFYGFFHLFGYEYQNAHFWKCFAFVFFIYLTFETLFEADFILSKLKETAIEKETLRQLAINQEFDTLKSQVNPHFLFNCFNTLSSLIAVDKQRAEQFLDELSKVYRYLLRNNEEGMSTVDNEVRFIHSYFRLLQTRHGEAVKMNLQIDKQYYGYLIPSLTLQLLVENVVKHNSLSKNKPLVIDIFSTRGKKLVVNNNIQPRTIKVPSNGVGLENIKNKYSLLNQPGFQVLSDNKNFTVVLPLIWKPATIHS